VHQIEITYDFLNPDDEINSAGVGKIKSRKKSLVWKLVEDSKKAKWRACSQRLTVNKQTTSFTLKIRKRFFIFISGQIVPAIPKFQIVRNGY
jgi:hypothetical protein